MSRRLAELRRADEANAELLIDLADRLESIPLTTQSIEPETTLYRVAAHSAERNPIDLNPHDYANDPRYDPILDGSRFAPFRAGKSRWVATTYLGENEQAALGETILRDCPVGSDSWSIARDRIAGKSMFELILRPRLELIRLRGSALQALRLRQENLIGTGPHGYPGCQALARAIYRHPGAAAANGLIWTSRQISDRFAVLIWKRRLPKRWADIGEEWALDAPHCASRLDGLLAAARVAVEPL